MIRSNIPAIYIARTQETAIIEMAITEFNYNLQSGNYIATVEDYAIIEIENKDIDGNPILDIDGNPTYSETKRFISSKQSVYTSSQIDGLFNMLQNPINIGESFEAEQKKLITMALLYVTKSEVMGNGKTVHGLAPENWNLYVAPEPETISEPETSVEDEAVV